MQMPMGNVKSLPVRQIHYCPSPLHKVARDYAHAVRWALRTNELYHRVMQFRHLKRIKGRVIAEKMCERFESAGF